MAKVLSKIIRRCSDCPHLSAWADRCLEIPREIEIENEEYPFSHTGDEIPDWCPLPDEEVE